MFGRCTWLVASLLPVLGNAHFQIISPDPRGYDEDKLSMGPCGGQDSVSSKRSMFPITGGTIQLNMEHSRSVVQVNLALGNQAVDAAAFNVSIMPLIQEMGLGKFCLADLMIPSTLDVKDGQNATIQVITNGDPNGGLYNCADITFSTAAKPGPCTNGTGVSAKAYNGNGKSANMTTESDSNSDSGSSSSGGTATTSASGSKATGAASPMIQLNAAGFLGLVICVTLFVLV